MKDTFISFVGK